MYPLPELLGGMLRFQFDQAEKIVSDLQAILDTENVPAGAFYWVPFSNRGKPGLMMAFSWASTDFEEGRRLLKKVKALGTVVMIWFLKVISSISSLLTPPSMVMDAGLRG